MILINEKKNSHILLPSGVRRVCSTRNLIFLRCKISVHWVCPEYFAETPALFWRTRFYCDPFPPWRLPCPRLWTPTIYSHLSRGNFSLCHNVSGTVYSQRRRDTFRKEICCPLALTAIQMVSPFCHWEFYPTEQRLACIAPTVSAENDLRDRKLICCIKEKIVKSKLYRKQAIQDRHVQDTLTEL